MRGSVGHDFLETESSKRRLLGQRPLLIAAFGSLELAPLI